MSEKNNNQEKKQDISAPGVIDTKFAYPNAQRLQLLYEKRFKENRDNVRKVKIKKFAEFIGDIFEITVPRICIVKRKKMKRVFHEDILGVCIMKGRRCKAIWLQKEMINSRDDKLAYLILMHELRHCWQGKHYEQYYGEHGDTPELETLREADARAFSELVFYYLYESWYSYEINSPVERKQRNQIENVKDEIRMELWLQIIKYYCKHEK